jgi:hypothetical protein
MTDLADNKAARVYAGVSAVLLWIVLAIQFYLQLVNAAADVSTAERIVRFFSYFTTLTNMLAAIVWTAVALFQRNPIGRFLSRSTILSAVAVYISIVGLIYSLFLRGVWDPQGWQKFADHSLHDASPILFISFWLIFVPKSELKWIDPVKWLVYPVAYVFYYLVRGAIVNWYPYWFADAGQLGYPVALRNSGLVLIAFIIVGLIFVGLARLMTRGTRIADTDI